jgi:hypothetical protein
MIACTSFIAMGGLQIPSFELLLLIPVREWVARYSNKQITVND